MNATTKTADASRCLPIALQPSGLALGRVVYLRCRHGVATVAMPCRVSVSGEVFILPGLPQTSFSRGAS